MPSLLVEAVIHFLCPSKRKQTYPLLVPTTAITTYSPVEFSDDLAIFSAVDFMSYFESKFCAESKSDWCQSPGVECFEKIGECFDFTHSLGCVHPTLYTSLDF